jgi:hypothetical protein
MIEWEEGEGREMSFDRVAYLRIFNKVSEEQFCAPNISAHNKQIYSRHKESDTERLRVEDFVSGT